MGPVAVICEYNPFHAGHEKQIALLRKRFSEKGVDPPLLAVMSGNYVQRGEPALFDKYLRAKAALCCGIDLVVELPYPYSAAPADRFAYAGARIAAQMGAQVLAFGSESVEEGKEEELLRRLAAVSDYRRERASDPSFAPRKDRKLSSLREEQRRFEAETGLAYPASPNDRLAAEYVRSARRLREEEEFSMMLLPLPRTQDGLSAGKTRSFFTAGEQKRAEAMLPKAILPLYAGAPMAEMRKGLPILLSRLRMASPEALHALFDIPREIADRLVSAAQEADDDSFDRFFEKLRSKNDTDARLRRSLLTALFSVTVQDLDTPPAYTLLLGASARGRAYLKERRKASGREKTGETAPLPVFGSLSDAFAGSKNTAAPFLFGTEETRRQMQRQAELQMQAELLYGFFAGRVRGRREILQARPILPETVCPADF